MDFCKLEFCNCSEIKPILIKKSILGFTKILQNLPFLFLDSLTLEVSIEIIYVGRTHKCKKTC